MPESLNNEGKVITDILKLQPKQELILKFGIGRRGRQETKRIVVDHVEDALPGDPLGPSITFTTEPDLDVMPAGSKPQKFTLQTGEMEKMTLIDPNQLPDTP
jgi:hypothetical protein